MDQEAIRILTQALKEQEIDLVVTLPEEPTSHFTNSLRGDPYFTVVDAASEGSGIACTAAAALAGRNAMFVTGVAGMMVGTWALGQLGTIFNAPMLVLASYRGDFGDATGIPGAQSLMFKQVAEPLLDALHLPYKIVDKKADLAVAFRDAYFACQDYEKPIVVLLTGDILW
jgi:sulfopyruvate decarboxylase TPP-binding subunit